MALLAVNNLKKSFVVRTLFENVSFEIDTNDHVGFIGRNGTGKTTLFKILLGLEEYDEGSVYRNKGIKMASMEQTVLSSNSTLYESVLEVFNPLMQLENEIESINTRIENDSGDNLEKLVDKQQRLHERYEREGGLIYKSITRSTLLGLGFLENELSQPLSTMSGGQQNKAQLAKLLLSGSELLLLDEPTNHLDINSVEWLEEFLKSYKGAYIVISHDRYFLDKVTNKTMELSNGHISVSNGNYSRHMELKESENEVLRRKYLNTQKEIRRIYGIVEQQRRWGQAHNFVTAEAKLKQIERLKSTLVEPEKEESSIHFAFKADAVGGNDVLLTKGLSKNYGEKNLFKNADIHIRKGERVFLLGANGCGKTTLLKIITNKEHPSGGTYTIGSKVKIGFYDQTMSGLNGSNTALDEIWNEYPHLSQTEVRSALASFLFRGDDVLKNVEMLSGGEKARIQLLKIMLSGSNFLVLDEPTNHLDIASREALESALEEYDGSMLVVTHDRYLINRIADRILSMENGEIVEYIGGYDEYQEARNAENNNNQEIVSEEKTEKSNDYKMRKEKRSAINKASGEVKRIEQKISNAEQELENIEKEMAKPEVAIDYKKVAELSKNAEDIKETISSLYEEWEKASELLEELENS